MRRFLLVTLYFGSTPDRLPYGAMVVLLGMAGVFAYDLPKYTGPGNILKGSKYPVKLGGEGASSFSLFMAKKRIECGGSDTYPCEASDGVSSLPRLRLRRRMAWVGSLQGLLGGEFGIVGALLRRRWMPDLPSRFQTPEFSFVAGLLRDGVKILGGGSIPSKDDELPEVPFVHIRTVDGTEHTIFPDLVAKLSALSCFRKRDSSLLAVLRNRAFDWVRARGLRWTDVHNGFASSVVLGACVSASELNASAWATKEFGSFFPLA